LLSCVVFTTNKRMKILSSAITASLLFLLVSAVYAQRLTPAEAKRLDGIEPGPTIRILSGDSEAERVAKAAMVVPHPRQMAWQELEFTCFIHFGINTFTGRSWGDGKENPDLFNPTAVDTDQWCRAAKDAGMKMMLITMKHHDGFCLWQTRYNEDFSVRNSPWKNGNGDVLRQLSGSCKKYGLKLGVYLSPADLYQMENKKGLYGNESKYRESTIPTDPKSFRTRPDKGRKPPDGSPTFKYVVDDYNRYMLNQLYECLTEYGPIDEVWFDGAHPKRKGDQQYTKDYWIEMIYALAPNASVAIGGPDVRWCGNEHGGTRESEWSALPLKGDPDSRPTWDYVNGVNYGSKDQGGRSQLSKAEFIRWWPSEVDTSIRHGWFWRDEQQQGSRWALAARQGGLHPLVAVRGRHLHPSRLVLARRTTAGSLRRGNLRRLRTQHWRQQSAAAQRAAQS
jgi:alpha-L-fucosidase